MKECVYSFRIFKHRLNFHFVAGTSRGKFTFKDTWFIKLWEKDRPEIFGLGECGPLPGLSIDYSDEYEKVLQETSQHVLENCHEKLNQLNYLKFLKEIPFHLPSVKFGLETALLDLINGGQQKVLECDFIENQSAIPINGLIWMGSKDFMLKQLAEKIDQGFKCIKIKVGAIDFEDELDLIKAIRRKYSEEEIMIRLDANGAFTESNVFQVLDKYSKYQIHSIEQPVRQGQFDLMTRVCRDSPIPIALDEELIGIKNRSELLQTIRPDYIILKPTLLGGISESMEWLNEAQKFGIGWWMTSLLESNIGLNVIAQLTSSLQVTLFQGLGTGQLYENNIASPLTIKQGKLSYDKNKKWDLGIFDG